MGYPWEPFSEITSPFDSPFDINLSSKSLFKLNA